MSRIIEGAHDTYALGEQLLWSGRSTFYRLGSTCVYKEFAAPRIGERELSCIAKLVDVARMPQDQLRGPFRRIAWPLDYVVDDNRVMGVVLPRAAPTFFDVGEGYDIGPRPLGNLMTPGAATMRQRLLLLADLASAFEGLEYLDLVHGDLSENNATWRLAPRPALLVLDCDGLRRMSDPPRGEATPEWRDPRLDARRIAAHDQASDRWALALVIWRVIVADLWAKPPVDFEFIGSWPLVLLPHLRAAFAEPLSASRPSPEAWYEALRTTAADGVACRRLDELIADLRDGRVPQTPPAPAPPPASAVLPQLRIERPPRPAVRQWGDPTAPPPVPLMSPALARALRPATPPAVARPVAAAVPAASAAPAAGARPAARAAPRASAGARTPSRPAVAAPARAANRPAVHRQQAQAQPVGTRPRPHRRWGRCVRRTLLVGCVAAGIAPWALGDTSQYEKAYDTVATFAEDMYTRATSDVTDHSAPIDTRKAAIA